MSRKERVVIVGGGVTGLTAAYALEKLAPDLEVIVVEGGSRLGGNVVTVQHNGFLIDGGPDSWVATKPHATELAKELGLGDELIGTIPENRRVYIAHDGRLHPMPEGVQLGIPTEVMPLAASELFTWDAKLRMGLELAVPRKDWHEGADESVSSFLQRRFGDQLADRLAGPLLAGIFAGNADDISVRAAFPQLVEAEKKYGSLILAMRAMKAARHAAHEDEKAAAPAMSGKSGKSGRGGKKPSAPTGGSGFLTLKRGMGDLILNLAHRVSAEVRLGTKVASIQKTDPDDPRGRFRVFLRGAGRIFADHVLFTGPAHAARAALSSVEPELETALQGLDYASTATAFLAFKRKDVDHALDAAGYIVPRSSGRAALACTWVGSKWEHRVPGGHALLRLFFGGDGREHILALPDDELADLARRELEVFVPLNGKPVFSKVFRYTKASPQPRIGHLSRMAKVTALLARHPGLYLAGNGYDGVGIPECVRQARGKAQAIASSRVLVQAFDPNLDRGSMLPP